ncbi:Uncharacterised protein [Vibrio cholerae]|nr:Uncharacterised protein [Vibrio cholerae]
MTCSKRKVCLACFTSNTLETGFPLHCSAITSPFGAYSSISSGICSGCFSF